MSLGGLAGLAGKVGGVSWIGMTPLTYRQQEVLGLWLRGTPYKELAGILGISPETVNPHLKNIAKKLGARGISRAALWDSLPHGLCGVPGHSHGRACVMSCPTCGGTTNLREKALSGLGGLATGEVAGEVGPIPAVDESSRISS